MATQRSPEQDLPFVALPPNHSIHLLEATCRRGESLLDQVDMEHLASHPSLGASTGIESSLHDEQSKFACTV